MLASRAAEDQTAATERTGPARIREIRQAGPVATRPTRIGILAPMPSELGPVVKAMGLTRNADGTHAGRVGGVDVVAAKTGMGLALATAAATRMLDTAGVDH